MGEQAPVLHQIDAALLGLRHLWTRPSPTTVANEGGVELSTVWVVDALARGEAAGRLEVSVRDLAGALDVAHSTASRLLDRAVASGMVTRGRSSTDARSVSATLTPAGRDLAVESAAFRAAYLGELTVGWTAAERRTFADLLGRFSSAASRTPPGSMADPT